MAREDRPYMPWYYKDWLTSPDRFSMTYEQRGVYRDLLDFAWDQRGLPANLEQLRTMLGMERRQFLKAWETVATHFEDRDGRLCNPKQERVRADADAYRREKQEAGRRGGKTRAERQAEGQANVKQTSSTEASKTQAEGQAESKPSLAFALSLSKEIPEKKEICTSDVVPVTTSASSPSSLVVSPLQFEKAQKSFAFYGSRLKVPHVLHGELRDKLGGDNPESVLQAWYLVLNAEAEDSREPITDVFVWLRPKFVVWADAAAFDAEIAKMQPRVRR